MAVTVYLYGTVKFVRLGRCITSRPLQLWKRSVQAMLEKGKECYVEHLCIIQLCEADLNFILNVISGYRLLRSAQKEHQLDTSQYATPGQTCHGAVWNKTLYCDLMWQTLSSGIMADYDASAAYDRVLHVMSIITCRRLGLPHNACMFMYHLLQNMDFFLLTSFGIYSSSFKNNEDPLLPGQGMLQGSSSAAPIYNISTDVSLATYNKLAHGASFTHASTGRQLMDYATQYVDDKTEMANAQGLQIPIPRNPNPTFMWNSIFQAASENTKIWPTLLWLSGGSLNAAKCFYYYIHPKYNFRCLTTEYLKEKHAPGSILMINLDTTTTIPLERLEPSTARRTLGVMLAPDRSNKQQIKSSIVKATTFIGKIKYSKLSGQELEKIEQVIIRAKCSALGLNEHFPWAILYGPMEYGGMALPTSLSKTVTTRINYFLYHIHTELKVGIKLDA
jgi:hypothetical protein